MLPSAIVSSSICLLESFACLNDLPRGSVIIEAPPTDVLSHGFPGEVPSRSATGVDAVDTIGSAVASHSDHGSPMP